MTYDIGMRRSAIGIFFVSTATLMLELLVNKVLSFSTWGSLGYMIIGSAIFGFSIAGVAIALWKPHSKYALSRLTSYASLIFAISVAACYIIMNVVPFNFENVLINPFLQTIYFTIWYLSLLVPFTMTGFIIALLLMVFHNKSNRLYAADLAGAGLGCLVVLPLFPKVGAAGQYLIIAAIGAVCVLIWVQLF